ncbi:MAG: amylo-alpha-1,6-glucosidase, partial [Bacteroidota bacterium]
PFLYTNKESAYYYGETNRSAVNSWEGLNVFGNKFLDDYDLLVDGHLLDRTTAVTTVYPDYLRRVYPGGIVEEVRLADSLAILSVAVTIPGQPAALEFVPWRSDGLTTSAFQIVDSSSTQFIANLRHLHRTPSENYPVWLAIQSVNPSHGGGPRLEKLRFSPVSLKSTSPGRAEFLIAVGDDVEEVSRSLARYRSQAAQLARARRARMEHVLSSAQIRTDDPRFDRAFGWARLSLDALVMNQVCKGIFAGLPWFNNYWGRDTFISLPGATLVTGRYNEAREILLSFSAFQNTDTASTNYGRIPNIVTTTDKAYNTADGTPRFVMMAKEYVDRSGDSSFIRTIYPVIRRATEGTILHHLDSLGFLVHGDAETWMDAVGPDGPWSPRGNRANDIQALWVAQLESAIWFADQSRDSASSALWKGVRDRCETNFLKYFVRPGDGLLADHLMADGTPNLQLRPNQIFCASLLNEATRAGVLRTVTTKLTYEYGVASLSQEDENFHPYHQYEPYYPKDAAYHNGTVWTWLQGPLISELCRADRARTAFKITRNSIHQILDRGGIGTQSELLDAIPRPGEQEPRLSGTVSQAWNLAEFVRNYYDDYLGIRVNQFSRTLSLNPHLPASIAKAEARIPLSKGSLKVSVDTRPGVKIVRFDTRDASQMLTAVVELPSPADGFTKTLFSLPPGQLLTLNYATTHVTVASRQGPIPASTWKIAGTGVDSLLGPLPLAIPELRPNLRALRGPEYPLIPDSLIKKENPAATVLVDQTDPPFDDVGTGQYVYPQSPLFVPGSFDLLRFTVRADSTDAYFTLRLRALSNPGWHPEYGFQLTYVAIAIDQNAPAGAGRQDIPANSGFTLPPGSGYERLILVGGGVRIEDAAGSTLAAYIPSPADTTRPLGNILNGTISFSVPLRFLGSPSGDWRYTVLAGGQDDHGGAGLGEFRTVEREAGEWHGGGKKTDGESNVYDTLQTK